MLKVMHFSSQQSQRGAALIITLVLLLVMSLLGVATMRGTTEQERMSGAFLDHNRAFQAAESALREGERTVQDVLVPTFSGTNGWYNAGDDHNRPNWERYAADPAQTGTGVMVYSRDHGLSRRPEYYIERLPPVVVEGGVGGSLALGDGAAQEELVLFRVVARGFGNSPGTVAVVESVFRR